MAEKERSEISTSGCIKRYFRFVLIIIQVAFVCLVVYEHVVSFCRTSSLPVVRYLQPTHAPSSISTSENKTKSLMLAFVSDVPTHPDRMFYNRVPKCGSHTFLDVINQMSIRNNFTFTRAPEYMRFYLDNYWQMKFVDRLRKIDTPMLYERHIHFVDFPHYGVSQPVYINLIRDPLQRLVSWYYFRRFQSGHERQMDEEKRNRTFDECVLGNHSECINMQGGNPEEGYFKIIPFFCGQQEFCRNNQEKALQVAMRNVDQNYLVVGVTEQFGDYVGALEHLLPTYFSGANTFYQSSETELKAKHRTQRKVAPSPQVSHIMQELLKHEYKFYKFVRQKFNRLLYGLRLKINSKDKSNITMQRKT